MSVIVGVAWIVFAVMWQTAGLPVPGLFGARADVALLIVLAWSYVRSPEDALVLAFAGGMALDGLSSHALGISVLALLPTVVLGTLRGARVLDTDWMMTMVLAVLATLSYHAILVALLAMTGNAPAPVDAFARNGLPAALMNAMLIPPLYLALLVGSLDMRIQRRQIRTND